jgi:hypothetical protein
MADDGVVDVAIVGAGVSGAYCAYRLTGDTRLTVAMFEREARVGGRLWSYRWPEADALVELGGEAFSPIHANVAGLVRTLGLAAVPHREFATLNRLHLRDRLVAVADLTRAGAFPAASGAAAALRYFVPPAYLAPAADAAAGRIDDPSAFLGNHILAWLPAEVQKAFGDLIGGYAARIGALGGGSGPPPALTSEQALTLMTPEIYAALGRLIAGLERANVVVGESSARILGSPSVPLRDFNFWSVVVRDFGQEVYELFRGAGYDNTSALYFNMLELVENLLIGALFGMANPGFWSLEGGFDALPKALVRQAQARGATLDTGMTLTGIARDAASGILTLSLADASGNTVQRQARRVVMSAPVTAFDAGVALDGFDPALAARFARNRQGLFAVPAGKLYLVYPEPWWQRMSDLPVGSDPLYGYANTDLPSRAVYYKGLCGDGRRGLITAALTDGINADFWASFVRLGAPLFPGTGGGTPADLGAPRLMVDAGHRILGRMHAEGLGGPLADTPVMALYHGWDRAGAGWSAWHSGVDIHAAATKMRRPFCEGAVDEGLYCCGDSVAERHGWVEDVLESAEAMLREAFGLAPAAWLPGAETF